VARLDLAGRPALVTGAASGIGLDTARRLRARGARLALLDVDAEGLEREARALGALALVADVADRSAMEAAVERAAGELGGLDVVVANAGITGPRASLRTLEAGELERTLDVNLLGEWNAVRPALPHVVAARGHVLFVASLLAAVNGTLIAPYAISKAGVEQLGRALRTELAVHGASAGVAYFGFIDTPMVRGAFEDPITNQARGMVPAWVTRPVPVGRAGSAIVRGIERRSARVTAPRWVSAVLALRGPLAVAGDARLGRDERVQESVRAFEARRGR
jgi:NAD(P)-dependent dehydrogenase (short-subunit alcohol dehydrogenase family)